MLGEKSSQISSPLFFLFYSFVCLKNIEVFVQIDLLMCTFFVRL